ncbi:MAG: MIP/aquaporin family protein [Patescibacteria group bacterium]
MQKEALKKYTVEAIGTFFLVLTILFSGEPLAVGAILIAMIYIGGYISGGHYNPAVTLAVYMTGKMKKPEAIRYIAFQIVGGLAAGFINYLITGDTLVPQPSYEYSLVSIVLAEAIFTFALASAVLHATASKRTIGNEYYALAIGLTVAAAAYAIGPISGGVINPAVAIGTIIIDLADIFSNFGNLVLYIVGASLGGMIAAQVFNWLEEK